MGHVEPHALGCVEHAYGRVVVYAEEAVGAVFACEYARGGALGIVAVVAYLHQALVELEAVVHQGVFVAVVAVLAYLHVQWRPEEGHALAAPLDEVAHSAVAALIVVDHHAAAVDAGAYAVVEHKGHAVVDEILEVIIFLGVLGLAHDDAAHLVLVERAAYLHLALIFLVALRHDDAVAPLVGLLLDAAEHRREIVVCELGNDHAYHLARAQLAVAQGGGNHVGKVVVLTGETLYFLVLLPAYAGAVFECARHGGHRHAEHSGYVLHRQLLFLAHFLLILLLVQ